MATLGISTFGQTAIASTAAAEFRNTLETYNAGNLSTGTIPSPVAVPLARVLRDDQRTHAAGLTIGSTMTSLANQSLGSVSSGDRILCFGQINNGTKGGAGYVELQVNQSSGTASGVFANVNAAIYDSQIVSSGTLYQRSMFGVFNVSAGGTFTLGMRGLSSGGDITGVTANIHGIVLRGASS